MNIIFHKSSLYPFHSPLSNIFQSWYLKPIFNFSVIHYIRSFSINIFLRVALRFKLIKRSSTLYLDGSGRRKQKIFFQFYQGAKFGFGIHDEKLAFFEYDFSVFAWDRDVSDANFALVASSDLDGSVLFGGDEMQTALFFIFLSVAQAL